MIDPWQAQDRLHELREPEWLERRVRALAPLPGLRRGRLRKLLTPARFDGGVRLRGVRRQLDRMSDDGVADLWAKLFPGLAPHVARAHLEAHRRPYLTGPVRRPFRAPGHGETASVLKARFFTVVCDALHGLDPDVAWLASHAHELPPTFDDPTAVGWLLGSILRSGGPAADAVRSELRDAVGGEVGAKVSRAAIGGLLSSDDAEDWAVVGRLLLAAQRQEGLRQTILESVDEAEPGAFRHMIGVVMENDLERFSATVRAFDVWLGMEWAGGSVKIVRHGLERLACYLDDPASRNRAIEAGDAEDAYLALWTLAFEDAPGALIAATAMLGDPSPERRYAALTLVDGVGLPESVTVVAERVVSREEDDPRLQMALVDFLSRVTFTSVSDDLFDATVELFRACPERKRRLDPIVWPWTAVDHDRRAAGAALRAMGVTKAERMIPFAATLDTHDCVAVVQELAGTGSTWRFGRPVPRKRRELTREARALMLELVGDARRDVQLAAFEALEPSPVLDDEVERLVGLLHRQAATLRMGALERLLRLDDREVIRVATTLLADRNAKRHAAGLDLLGGLIEAGRSVERARAALDRVGSELAEPGQIEAAERLADTSAEVATLDDCLGLLPRGARATLPKPSYAGVRIETPAAAACLGELGGLIVQNAEVEIEVREGAASERELLAAAGWRFPSAVAGATESLARERLPLAETWLDWLRDRGERTRDPDGLELARAWAWVLRGTSHRRALPPEFSKERSWNLQIVGQRLLEWMLVLEYRPQMFDLLVQHAEDALARSTSTADEKADLGAHSRWGVVTTSVVTRLGIAETFVNRFPKLVRSGELARFALVWMRALDRGEDGGGSGPSLEAFAAAYDEGRLTEADLVWLLLSPRPRPKPKVEGISFGGPDVAFGPIREATRLRPPAAIADRPALADTVRRVRDRLVEVEAARGERPTAASTPASMLRHAGGAEVLFRLARALGRDKLVRQYEWGEPTRAYSFSRLIALTSPAEGDTHEAFTGRFRASELGPKRLLEMAMYAPQWAGHVERALEMDGLEDAVWWIHAHTKQNAYWRDQDFRAVWAARISERTDLEAEDLEEGAVDVAWFRRVVGRVGVDRWPALMKPAKYASNSGGHKRAQLFADAMLGNVTVDELVARIDAKRHQDSVRALGLVPLADAPEGGRADAHRRYERFQRFAAESRKFGSQRQASERRAVAIGMQNLARTAGFRDPRRLEWAMEAEAVSDLAGGPKIVTVGETTLALAIDSEGRPSLSITKGERALKSVPARIRQDEAVAELRARTKELRGQRSRMRASLEDAMVRGSVFEGRELAELFGHPLLRPLVERLVLQVEDGAIGYPTEGGRALRGVVGELVAVGAGDDVRIAHPIHLLARGDWHAWQHECFAAERVQPFKQLFREAYPRTAEEAKATFTRRYAGHQVGPRQALALLKSRQWLVAPDEGIQKTYHDEDLIAEVWVQEPFATPADIEALTLEAVTFVRRGARREPIPLADVPDRVFSEAMRDLDLVVSVAHAGGVDPEASASTVEMRRALVEETCALLGLSNVRVEGRHALIEGTLGRYGVHLGSAVATFAPGRALVIVAVHSQYRGRIFLPFADDDPKTAEVLAKTLLLARDEQIKDPSILDQIRG